jgi:hypothetical protein
MRRHLAATSLLLLAAACSDPLPAGEPVDTIDMRAATGLASLDLVGVAVEAETGRRFALDATTGIWEIDAAGAASPVVPMDSMLDSGLAVRLPFTDLVALGDDRLALTAIGDGFLLDLADATMTLHFCYEPGFQDIEEVEQRTDAVTFDPATNRLIAQPRTYNVATGEVRASQIGYYDRDSGFDLQWYDLDVGFVAGGMAVSPELGLIVAAGERLYRFDGAVHRFDELGRFGVGGVDGLAFDAAAGTLLVVDNGADRLHEIAAEDLGL